MRISDWSSDVCSSDLTSPSSVLSERLGEADTGLPVIRANSIFQPCRCASRKPAMRAASGDLAVTSTSMPATSNAPELSSASATGPESPSCCAMTARSEEHTSELQSLMRISYAVFCLKKKQHNNIPQSHMIQH